MINKKLRKVLEILLLVELLMFSIIVTLKFKTLFDKYNKLEKRVKQLEIDYKLYQYDIESTKEYMKVGIDNEIK